jgi:hypothetical protein
MKIRNGFVSNSSSSSFVVKIDDLTVYHLLHLVRLANDFSENFKSSVINFEAPRRHDIERDYLTTDLEKYLVNNGIKYEVI